MSNTATVWRIKKVVTMCNCNVFLFPWQALFERPRVGDIVIVNDQFREIISVQKLGWKWLKLWYNIYWEGNRDEPDPIDDEEDEDLEVAA